MSTLGRASTWLASFCPSHLDRVESYIKKNHSDADSMIDVGCGESRFVGRFNFRSRFQDDKYMMPPAIENVQSYSSDLDYAYMMDLVTCLQVLEHQWNPEVLLGKLLSLGRVVIITVSYCWPSNSVQGHVQDPLTMDTVRSWSNTPWSYHKIIWQGIVPRLLVVFDQR